MPAAVRAALDTATRRRCRALADAPRGSPRCPSRAASRPRATRPSARRRRCRGRAARRSASALAGARAEADGAGPGRVLPVRLRGGARRRDRPLPALARGEPPAAGPGARGAYPAVPSLILQGGEDLRTPPESSARVAAALQGAPRVVVPGVGHAVVGGDPCGCGVRRLVALPARAARGAATCPRVATGVPGRRRCRRASLRQVGAAGAGSAGAWAARRRARRHARRPAFSLSPALPVLSRRRAARRHVSPARRPRGRAAPRAVPGVRISGVRRGAGALRLRIGGRAGGARAGHVCVAAGG